MKVKRRMSLHIIMARIMNSKFISWDKIYFFKRKKLCKAWEPNSAATFCGQPHKQASAQGHNNNSNAAGCRYCEDKVGVDLSSRPCKLYVIFNIYYEEFYFIVLYISREITKVFKVLYFFICTYGYLNGINCVSYITHILCFVLGLRSKVYVLFHRKYDDGVLTILCYILNGNWNCINLM